VTFSLACYVVSGFFAGWSLGTSWSTRKWKRLNEEIIRDYGRLIDRLLEGLPRR
jgi:hypothetical protein